MDKTALAKRILRIARRKQGKRLSNTEKTVVIVPIAVEPVQIQLAPVVIKVQNGHVAIIIGITPEKCGAPPVSLRFGPSLTKNPCYCIAFGIVIIP